MKAIINTKIISGGNPSVAVAAGVAVFTGAAGVIQAFDTITEAGDRIGDKLYNYNNPDDGLGKMVYTKDDFKQPNWYLPANQHPNNASWNSFNNGFGNF